MPYKDAEKARECSRIASRRYRAKDPARAIAATMRWRKKNREYVALKERDYKRKMRLERPDDMKDCQLRSMYGVTLAWLRATTSAQSGRCAICRNEPSGRGNAGTLHIDHDHNTGKVRALLCVKCNLGIARLREDPSICRAAAAYLEKHKGDIHE